MNSRLLPLGTPLWRLLWKDERTVRHVGILGLVTIVSLTLILVFLFASDNKLRAFDEGVFMTMCFSIPSFMAFAAGFFLVTNEEESNTLNWTRGLPVGWKLVLASKLIVSAGWTLVLILTAIGAWGLVRTVGVFPFVGSVRMDLSFVGAFARLIYFDACILLIGLAVSHCFRSGLVTVFATLLALLAFAATSIGLHYQWEALSTPLEIWAYRSVLLAGLAVFLSVSVKRRMTGSRLGFPVYSRMASSIGTAQRLANPISLHQPTPTLAIFWQQYRHAFWFATPIVVLIYCTTALIGVIGVIGVMGDVNSGGLNVHGMLSEAFMFSLYLSVSILGVMAFCCDACNDRVQFFAVRGVGLLRVWVIHVGVMACYALLVLVPFLCLATPTHPLLRSAAIGCFAWSLGVVTPQVVRRPSRSFATAPLGATVSIPWFVAFCNYYPEFHWLIYLSAIVLLVASWRLFPRFAKGQCDRWFLASAFGYGVIAIITPMVLTLGYRWGTTPARDQAFFHRMTRAVAQDAPGLDVTYRILDSVEHDESLDGEDDFARRLRLEIASTDVGGQVSLQELEQWADRWSRKVHSQALADVQNTKRALINDLVSEVLIKWASQVREDAVLGKTSLAELIRVGEATERLASDVLMRGPGQFSSNRKWKDLVAMIPNRHQRKDSRRVAIIREWRRYSHKERLFKTFCNIKIFNGQCLPIGIELARIERSVEAAIKLLVDQIATDGNFADRNQRRQLIVLWGAAIFPNDHALADPRDELNEVPSQFSRHNDWDDRLIAWQLQLNQHEVALMNLKDQARDLSEWFL